MRFKVDENLPVEVAELLRSAGYDAETVHSQQLSGRPDSVVAKGCQEEGRTIVTLDLDFADIREYPPSENSGFIALRVQHQDKEYVLELPRKLIPMFEVEQVENHLWIVEEGRVRIR